MYRGEWGPITCSWTTVRQPGELWTWLKILVGRRRLSHSWSRDTSQCLSFLSHHSNENVDCKYGGQVGRAVATGCLRLLSLLWVHLARRLFEVFSTQDCKVNTSSTRVPSYTWLGAFKLNFIDNRHQPGQSAVADGLFLTWFDVAGV